MVTAITDIRSAKDPKFRPCVRCGKHVRRASWTTPDGVACPSCARYVKPPGKCGVCLKLSHHLARDLKNGIDVPACPKCRRKNHVTCGVCRKHRPFFTRNKDGRPICKSCSHRSPAWTCPKCAKAGTWHSYRQCLNCYWQETLERRVATLCRRFRHGWVADCCRRYVNGVAARRGAQVAALNLDRASGAFHLLDAKFERPQSVTAESLFEAFGSGKRLMWHSRIVEAVRATPGVSSFDRDDMDRVSVESAIRTIVVRHQNAWFGKILSDLLGAYEKLRKLAQSRGWVGTKERYGAKTILGAVICAERFFEFASADGVSSVFGITQEAVDRFLGAYPGYRCSLASTLPRLSRIVPQFAKISINASGSLPRIDKLLTAGEQAELFARMTTGDPSGSAIAIALLVLYPVRAPRLMRLRHEDVNEEPDGTLTIRFAKVPVPIEPRVASLVKGLITRARPDSDFVFQSTRLGQHIRPMCLNALVKGIGRRRIFSSALYGAFAAGVTSPRALRDAFGVDVTTALDYEAFFRPDVRRMTRRSHTLRSTWLAEPTNSPA